MRNLVRYLGFLAMTLVLVGLLGTRTMSGQSHTDTPKIISVITEEGPPFPTQALKRCCGS